MLGDMFLWLVANLKQGVIYFIKQERGNHKIAWVYIVHTSEFWFIDLGGGKEVTDSSSKSSTSSLSWSSSLDPLGEQVLEIVASTRSSSTSRSMIWRSSWTCEGFSDDEAELRPEADVLVEPGEGKYPRLEIINQSNLVPTNILETFFILFANCIFFKKGLNTFHFSKNMFHFQNTFRNGLPF